MAEWMTWEQVAARRMVRTHLTDGSRVDDPARICADVLGIHAQVMSAAEVSVGIRAESMTRADVRDALWRRRSIVKTRGPRGTVHLLAADDLPMWTGALSAVPRRPPELLTEDQVEAVVEAIADTARDRDLTVDELTEGIVGRVGSWAGDRVMDAFQDKWPRWRMAEAVAFHRGVLSFGPGRARRTTYTNPGVVPMSRDAALAELVRRFLRAYGPVTHGQFARWLAAPAGWAAGVFAGLPGLETVDFEGATAWINAGDHEVMESDGGAGVRLLPYFDSYLINGFPRTCLFAGAAADRALSGGQAGNVPALLADGRVRGVWLSRRTGRTVAITVEPLARLTAAQRSDLRLQAVRIGQIMDGTAELTIGAAAVRPHA